MEYLEKILQFMGLLSIPSMGWNIFQYRNKKKIDKIKLDKSIKLKKLEIEELSEQNEFENNKNTKPNSIRYKPYEEVKKEEMRIKKANREMKKLYAELSYLEKLNGDDGFSKKDSVLVRIRRFFRLYKNEK